ncbi:MAG TPA: energy-coupling factor ABC transporter permease [Firmicutes bacterium]|nr:energy-coupling factor ABC transporter permease [Bacillota bacterium]
MSHLHIPDGVIPLGWSLMWLVLALIWLALSLHVLRREDRSRLVPRVGIFAAVMILGMSVEWFGVYHLNLTVFSGIALGPWAGFVAQFLANLMLSLLGHGGITTLGLNSLVLGSEVVIGYLLFRLFKRLWTRGGDARAGGMARRFAVPAFWATLVALVFSFTLMMGALGISIGDTAAVWDVLSRHHDNHGDESPNQAYHETEHGEAQHEALQDELRVGSFSLMNFIRAAVVPGVIGWPVEALIVAALVGYIGHVRPGFFQRL